MNPLEEKNGLPQETGRSEAVQALYEEVKRVIGTGEALLYESDTTTNFTIAKLEEIEHDIAFKVSGRFDNQPHCWTELDGQIVDLSVEQFGYPFEFPVTSERQRLYEQEESQPIQEDVLENAHYVALSSGFDV